MSERSTENLLDRLVTSMAVVAITITILSILFPSFPASLSIAVDTALIVLLAACANIESEGRRAAARKATVPYRFPDEQEWSLAPNADPAPDLHIPAARATMAVVRASSSDG